jgi:hypothetical protein
MISISEGLKIEIRKVNTRSPIRNWPRELELIFEGSFSDGFESSYSDQEWWRSSRQDNIFKELELDHLCNRIIEATLGSSIKSKKGAENEF